MKLYSTLITISLLFSVSYLHCMEKKNQSITSKRQPQRKQTPKELTKKTPPTPQTKNVPIPVQTPSDSTPQNTSSPELVTLLNHLIELKQDMKELRTQNSVSALQLDGLMELVLKQEETINNQTQQMAILLEAIQRSDTSRLSTLFPKSVSTSAATFVPVTQRTWPDNTNIWGSPNHPRPQDNWPSEDSSLLDSPNHPRDK